ncbi:hypothetical protein ALC57_16205 [Trachymyrmex cornetzi]|uniref:Uncharacterized protein n=1 Tax=Trachymyrmex cornetzi TaxID=471704 RepID=A0A195DFI0_9HYME|nr:hypothetical protein ALC57_16205 [Trachymyrmex cornetzi]
MIYLQRFHNIIKLLSNGRWTGWKLHGSGKFMCGLASNTLLVTSLSLQLLRIELYELTYVIFVILLYNAPGEQTGCDVTSVQIETGQHLTIQWIIEPIREKE